MLEKFIRVFVCLAAAVLFGIGGWAIIADKTPAASLAMGFAFLLVVMLFLSRFKKFSGFGFHAELWEEKQAEAAKLIDRLKGLAEATSGQLALVASRLGLRDSYVPNPEMFKFIEQISAVLKAAGTPAKRIEEILEPSHRRIELNYFFACRAAIEAGFARAHERLRAESTRKVLEAQSHAEIVARMLALGEIEKKFQDRYGTFGPFLEQRSLHEMFVFVDEVSELKEDDTLAAAMKDLNEDLKYYIAKRKLRRDIDVHRY